MTERVFLTEKEVKDTYFPHRSLEELEGREPVKELWQRPAKPPEPQQPKDNKPQQ
jgi:hypothetical protein